MATPPSEQSDDNDSLIIDKALSNMDENEMEDLLNEIENDCKNEKEKQDLQLEQIFGAFDPFNQFEVEDIDFEPKNSTSDNADNTNDDDDYINHNDQQTTNNNNNNHNHYGTQNNNDNLIIHNEKDANAKTLRRHKHKTFENFLFFEKIIAKNTISNFQNYQQNMNEENKENIIFEDQLFHCPVQDNFLLHGYLSSLKRYGSVAIIPNMIIHLIDSYYSTPNNKYEEQMKDEIGINWNTHKCIIQHNNVNLYRWDEKQLRWKQRNATNERGQTTLLYDMVKGFTRFVHFDKKRNLMRGLQVIEANQVISIEHDVFHSDDSDDTTNTNNNSNNDDSQIHDDHYKNGYNSNLNGVHGHHSTTNGNGDSNGGNGSDCNNTQNGHPKTKKSERMSTVQWYGYDYTYVINEFLEKQMHDSQQIQSLQKWQLQFIGDNHEYYANTFVQCYNNIIESEIKNEVLMLKPIKDLQIKPKDDDKDSNLPSLSNLNEYILGLQSSDEKQHIKYAQLIRRLLSIESNPPIQEIIDSGIVQRLIYLMQHSKSPQCVFECAWCLTNVASGNATHTLTLIKFNVIPALIKVFRNKKTCVEIKEQTLWALGNIAGDSEICRDLVLRHEILRFVLPLMRPYRMLLHPDNNNQNNNSENMDDPNVANTNTNAANNNNNNTKQRQLNFMRNLVWTLSNLSRGKNPRPKYNYVILTLHALNIILKDPITLNDAELLTDCCWALSYISDYSDNYVASTMNIPKILLESDIIDILALLLQIPNPQVKHPALRTIGNIATGNDDMTNKLLNKKGMLQGIAGLLNDDKPPIRREALWLVSNITAGDQNQIELILKQENILHSIITIITSNEEHFEVKKEAIWALSNATSGGSTDQIRYICDNGGILAICNYLQLCNTKQYFSKTFIVALEGLENVLHVGLTDALLSTQVNGMVSPNVYAIFVEQMGMLECMQSLCQQKEVSDDLKERLTSILDTYFSQT